MLTQQRGWRRSDTRRMWSNGAGRESVYWHRNWLRISFSACPVWTDVSRLAATLSGQTPARRAWGGEVSEEERKRLRIEIASRILTGWIMEKPRDGYDPYGGYSKKIHATVQGALETAEELIEANEMFGSKE